MAQKIVLVKEVNGTALLMGAGDPNIGLINPATYTTASNVDYINSSPAGSSLVWVYNFSSSTWMPDPGAGLFIGEVITGGIPGALLFETPAGRLGVSNTFGYTQGAVFPVGTPDVIHFGGSNIVAAASTGFTFTLPAKSGGFALLQDAPAYGQGVLSAATSVTVSDARVKASSIILVSAIGTPTGIEYTTGNIVSGVSFDILASAGVSATVNYIINDHN